MPFMPPASTALAPSVGSPTIADQQRQDRETQNAANALIAQGNDTPGLAALFTQFTPS